MIAPPINNNTVNNRQIPSAPEKYETNTLRVRLPKHPNAITNVAGTKRRVRFWREQ